MLKRMCVAMMIACGACGGDDGGDSSVADGGVDRTAAVDAIQPDGMLLSDTAPDSTTDSPVALDSRDSAAADAQVDAARDIAPDVAVDTPNDLPSDVAPDVRPDLPPDLGPDMSADTAPAAVCGDDVCDPRFEGQATCCRDCGCNSNNFCSLAMNKCVPSDSAIQWQFRHVCSPPAEPIGVRVFDVTHERLTGIYVYGHGQTGNITLSCANGSQICFGARQAETGRYWGVDIDISKDCDNCCHTCGQGNPAMVNLTCP